mgnify:CR=1 FL=1|tara:strand:- start:1057 stop:3084 length:2028 start_codon:yes stop_codon:yes gene_type:complete
MTGWRDNPTEKTHCKCQNQLCGKVTSYEEYIEEIRSRMESGEIKWPDGTIHGARAKTWMDKRYCDRVCYGEDRAFRKVTGDDVYLTPDEIRTKLLELVKHFKVTDITSQTMYEVLRDKRWTYMERDRPAFRDEYRRIMYHAKSIIPSLRSVKKGGTHSKKTIEGTNRFGFILLCEYFFPSEYEEFCSKQIYLLGHLTRKEVLSFVGGKSLDGNYVALDTILRYAVDNWERKHRRKMNMDDVHNFWRYPTFVAKEKLSQNAIWQLFDLTPRVFASEYVDNLSRDLFSNTMKSRAKKSKRTGHTFYTVETIELFLLHLEQIVRFPKTRVSNKLRNDNGRFAKSEFDFYKIALQYTNIDDDSVKRRSLETRYLCHNPRWYDEDFQRKILKYCVSELEPTVNITDDFPYDLSLDGDIHRVAGISTDELECLPLWPILCSRVWGFRTTNGIHTMIQKLWPDYEMVEQIWNHKSKLAELSTGNKIQDVVSYATLNSDVRVKAEYRYPLDWNVGNRKKRKEWMTYKDTGKPIDLDLYVPSFTVTNPLSEYYGHTVPEMIIELQGPHHYVVIKWLRGNGVRHRTSVIIDEDHPEWDRWLEEHETIVRHDRIKKRRFNDRIVYLPICKHVKPVTGVHGSIGRYNLRFLTEQNPKQGHGLAEMFENQKKDMFGGLIREFVGALSL